MQTGDADFAQFHEISVAIKDSISPILEVLQQIDRTFREMHANLVSAFTEAWDRGDHWRAAIRTSIATYHDAFQNSFRTELTKGVTELGLNPADYDLAAKPTDASMLGRDKA